ncbi:MAG: hypothetical protein K5695_09530 [Oscillospiraceae bacterium]|nr:hypothetical protein [Oscillospiraceae bacterium]
MKLMKMIAAFCVPVMMLGQMALHAAATEGTEPLQAYFSEDGKTLKIFTSAKLSDNASLLVGNATLNAEVQNENIPINTVFLIDNSTSIPTGLRDTIKTAVQDYVADMPETESVKVAIFDTETTFLADEYSNDSGFIDYELSKVDFKGQASLVYDAVMKVVSDTFPDQDVYYRTVLITDGVDSVEGTSFDYLRSVINENGRYHIDVVQVSKSDKQDVNLTAISNLGSNTYMLFKSDSNFKSLKPENVSMLKAPLINEVATGELKGVTIKNGDSDISLGSILFPQVEIAVPTTVPVEEPSTEELTEAPTLPAPTQATTQPAPPQKKGLPLVLLLGIIGAVVVLAGVIILVVVLAAKKGRKCRIAVNIVKDDERDQQGVGQDMWEFPVSSEFRVGRTLEPMSNDNTPLPRNHKAICESATNDDISSIGRNAFALSYNAKTQILTITNIAKGAVFTVETAGRKSDLRSGQSTELRQDSRILLGNYTTVMIQEINFDK